MKQRKFVKIFGSLTALALIVLVGMLTTSRRGQASSEGNETSEIRRGFAIAPVPLNLEGKDRDLVGLGSYIVNAQGDCNGCHSAGPEYAQGGNPYFGEPAKVNPVGYLGGGQDFGAFPGPGFPHIFPRNLTPDKTGRAEGGHTFAEFLQIMRHGIDLDHVHPSCSSTVTTNCLPPPFKGELLQIMPWPVYRNMSNHDLRAVYEYLSAVPCYEGPPAPSVLHNDCP